MHKATTLVHTEELAEVERHVLIDKLMQQPPQVVGVDVHHGQYGIRVVVARVRLCPLLLGALLHHVIPCINLVLLEIVEQVERCAA